MSRRHPTNGGSAIAESVPNEAEAYPFSNTQHNSPTQRRGPIEGPGGRKLVRRLTWRSTSYKFVAFLWVLGVFYLVWLIRDMFFFPSFFSSASSIVSHLDE